MTKYSADDLFDVFANLQSAGWHAIVIGGQAVNLWCARYANSIPELTSYQPLVSRDLDFHGGLSEAKLAMKLLSARGRLNSGADPSPNAGVIEVRMPIGDMLVIDILTSVYGVSSSELMRTAVTWSFDKGERSLALRVIHPVLLVESKLACLRSLPQENRQDEKHSILMGLVLRAWMAEQLSHPRSIFKAVERIATLMQTPDGLHGFSAGLELWDAVPLGAMRLDSAYNSFFEQRLGQLQNDVRSSRQRHAAAQE